MKYMKEKNNIGQALGKILDLLKLDNKDISAIYLYSIFAGILSLSLPLGIQSIISFVMAASISTSIIILIALVLVGTFFNGLLQVRQLELIEKVEQKLFVRYALEFGRRLPGLNIEKLDAYYLPELVNRFFDISTLQKSLRKLLIDIPAAVFQILLGTILLSFYHPLFIAFGIVLLLIVVLIIRYTSNAGFSTSLLTSDYKYKIAAWLQEMARSIKTFKYSRNASFHLQKTDNLTGGFLQARNEHFRILKIQYWSLIAFKLLITAAMLILGVSLLVNQQINIGQFIASDIVIISIISSIEKLITNMDQVYEALTAVEKLNKVANAALEESGSHNPVYTADAFEMEFRNVKYNYLHAQQNLLPEINFRLNPGDWMHISGESGSGKTTILRLMSGAFRNFSGQILINGLPLKNYDTTWIRNQTGILMGQQDIFEETLQKNICLDQNGIKPGEILEIARVTGLLPFIQNSEKGLETSIDPLGKRLPASTKHRILLSRALIGKSALILLDEPFRYLNKEEMENVLNYIKAKGSTVIITGSQNIGQVNFNHTLQLKNEI